MTLEIIGSIATAIAIIGVVLNNYRNRVCFCLWLVSNSLTFGIHCHAQIWSLAARDIVFLALACHGWFRWKTQEASKAREGREQKGKVE
jgi:nicotinamide riboside transporter PnuC